MELLCLLQAYNGNTALHVAASLQYRVSQLDAVRLLMRKGADPSARNLENEQPVHLVPDGLVGEQVRNQRTLSSAPICPHLHESLILLQKFLLGFELRLVRKRFSKYLFIPGSGRIYKDLKV